jgi:flagellar biosynthesis protein FliR
LGALSALDLFTPHGASVTALVTLRVTGVVWIAPVFSARTLPQTYKAAITVLLVAAVWPIAMGADAPVSITVSGVFSEMVVGLTVGIGAAIFIAAAGAAGDMLAVQMGLSGANVLDPMSQTQMPVLGHFMSLFVTSLILATGGHLVIIEALAASHAVIPTGEVINLNGILGVVGLGSTLLWMGLRMAAPIIAAMLLATVALGVLARTVPQLNVLMVAFPVQIGVGLFVLAATLPLIASAFTDWGNDYGVGVSGLLDGLTPSAEVSSGVTSNPGGS